jgi:hypothetical protein
MMLFNRYFAVLLYRWTYYRNRCNKAYIIYESDYKGLIPVYRVCREALRGESRKIGKKHHKKNHSLQSRVMVLELRLREKNVPRPILRLTVLSTNHLTLLVLRLRPS